MEARDDGHTSALLAGGSVPQYSTTSGQWVNDLRGYSPSTLQNLAHNLTALQSAGGMPMRPGDAAYMGVPPNALLAGGVPGKSQDRNSQNNENKSYNSLIIYNHI